MKHIIITSLCLLGASFSCLQATEPEEDGRIRREFTVTSLALDAYYARLHIEESQDTNQTNTQGGLTE